MFAFCPQTPTHITRAAAGHIILTPANMLLIMGQIILWSLSNAAFRPATLQSLAQRANKLWSFDFILKQNKRRQSIKASVVTA
jgi:hypothetical protein